MDVEADVRRLYRREVFQWALHGWTSSHRWAGTSGHPLQQLECYAALVIFAVCVCKSSQCRYWHSVALCSKDLRLICWSRWFLPEIIISSGFQHVQGSFLGFNHLTFWVGNAKKGHSDAKLLPCVFRWMTKSHAHRASSGLAECQLKWCIANQQAALSWYLCMIPHKHLDIASKVQDSDFLLQVLHLQTDSHVSVVAAPSNKWWENWCHRVRARASYCKGALEPGGPVQESQAAHRPSPI